MVQVGGLQFLESLGPSNGISLEIVPPGRVSTNHNIEQRQTFDFETSSQSLCFIDTLIKPCYLMIALCCGPENFFHENPTIQDDWDMWHVVHILWYQLVINHSPNWKQPSYMYIHYTPPWKLNICVNCNFLSYKPYHMCTVYDYDSSHKVIFSEPFGPWGRWSCKFQRYVLPSPKKKRQSLAGESKESIWLTSNPEMLEAILVYMCLPYFTKACRSFP